MLSAMSSAGEYGDACKFSIDSSTRELPDRYPILSNNLSNGMHIQQCQGYVPRYVLGCWASISGTNVSPHISGLGSPLSPGRITVDRHSLQGLRRYRFPV